MNQTAEVQREDDVLVVEEANASSAAGSGKHRAGKAKPAKKAKPEKAKKAKPEKAARKADDKVTPAAARAPRRSRLRRLRPVALPMLVLVTAGTGVSAFILHGRTAHTQHLQAIHSDAQAAMTTAVSDVKDILSYDYRQIDTNIDTAKREITGQLLTDYNSTAGKLLKQAASIKAIVTATVSASSVVHADTGRVTVLLYVDQESVKQLKGQKSPSTRIDPLRVQMTMTKIKGRWMASDLQPV